MRRYRKGVKETYEFVVCFMNIFSHSLHVFMRIKDSYQKINSLHTLNYERDKRYKYNVKVKKETIYLPKVIWIIVNSIIGEVSFDFLDTSKSGNKSLW